MDSEQLFSLVNMAIVPAWMLLIFAPRSVLTQRLVHSGCYSAIYALLYTLLILIALPDNGLDFSTLASVQALFQQPLILLAGWVHYLAFDLLIGAYVVREGQRQGIAHYWLVPTLLLCFYLGPIGFLFYFLLSFTLTKMRRTAPLGE